MYSQSLLPSFHVNLVLAATSQLEGTQVAPGPAVVDRTPLLQANGPTPVPGAVVSLALNDVPLLTTIGVDAVKVHAVPPTVQLKV